MGGGPGPPPPPWGRSRPVQPPPPQVHCLVAFYQFFTWWFRIVVLIIKTLSGLIHRIDPLRMLPFVILLLKKKLEWNPQNLDRISSLKPQKELVAGYHGCVVPRVVPLGNKLEYIVLFQIRGEWRRQGGIIRNWNPTDPPRELLLDNISGARIPDSFGGWLPRSDPLTTRQWGIYRGKAHDNFGRTEPPKTFRGGEQVVSKRPPWHLPITPPPG